MQVEIPPGQDTIGDLDVALGAWAKAEPNSYRYTMLYMDSSGCATHRYVVLVRNGHTESSRSRSIADSCDDADSSTGTGEKEAKPHLRAGMTITNLLTHIVQIECPLYVMAAQEIQCGREGASYEARYHPQMGFPISFDYFYGKAHDERFGDVLERQDIKLDFGYRITNFQIIE